MYTDAQNRPSNSQSLAGAAATTVSTDSIDLLTANRNPGRSGQMRMIAHVITAFTGGTAVYAQLISSANANLSSPTVLATGPTLADAAAIAGAELLDVPLPDSAQRYIGVQYVTTGTHTTGTVSANIVAASNRPATEIFMEQGL